MNHTMYDVDVIASLAFFIVAGMNPGGLGQCLLMQNKELAYLKSHPHLKPDCPYNTTGQDIVANLLAFAEQRVPAFLLGDVEELRKWEEQGGLLGADDNTKLMLHLELSDSPWFLAFIKPEYRRYVQGKSTKNVPASLGQIFVEKPLSVF
jgi:hypothetical protein